MYYNEIRGDVKLVEQLYKFYSSAGQWPAEFGEIQKQSQVFMKKTIEYYLVGNRLNIPINPKNEDKA